MRLDKYLCDNQIGSRSEVKAYIKKGFVTVNGKIADDSGMNINPKVDSILYQGKSVESSDAESGVYALYKPSGYVCSRDENDGIPVYDLLPESIRNRYSCVGRLDKDTTGLLLFTDNGELLHNLISPKRHVEKTYYVRCEKEVTEDDMVRLSEGVSLGDEEYSLPARCEYSGNEKNEILLTIREGKYHQIKRMLKATCNKVTSLHRVSFGNLSVTDLKLKEGEGRFLNSEETKILKAGLERK